MDSCSIRPVHASSAAVQDQLRLPVPMRIAGAIAIAGVFAGAWYFRGSPLIQHPDSLMEFVGSHRFTAIFVFLAVYAIAAAAAVPTLPMNLAAGWIWGPIIGGALSAVGAAGGATLTFVAARTVFGQPLRRRFNNSFLAWTQQEFDSKGWRFVAFVRLNPVFPSGPMNYLFGLTSIDARTYILATLVFLLPPSALVAWIGSAAAGVRYASDVAHMVRMIVVVSAAVTLMAAIRYGARYLNHARMQQK